VEHHIKEFPAGTLFFRQGEEGNVMYVIQSGVVEIRRKFYNREFLLAVLQPGGFFGEMALVTRQPRSASAVARDDTRVLVLKESTLNGMLKERPDISARIIQTMARRMSMTNRQMELFLFNHADKRLVHCLCFLAEEYLPPGQVASGAVYVPVPLSELADRCAMTRAQAVDVIERLAEAGLIIPASAAEIDGPGYVVADSSALIDFLKAQQSALKRNQQRRRAALMEQFKSNQANNAAKPASGQEAELDSWLSK